MGSPENPNNSTGNTIASDGSPQSAAVQDSLVFSYINNLSPIKPVKGTSVTHDFPGLSSPPLVFTSPQIDTHRQSLGSKRPQCHNASQSESSQQDEPSKHIATGVDGPEKPDSQMSSPNSSVKRSENVPLKVSGSLSSKGSMERHDKEDGTGNMVAMEQANECHEGNLSSHSKAVETAGKNGSSSLQSNLCQKGLPDFSMEPTFVHQYDQRAVQAGQSQLGKRRRLQFEETRQTFTANSPASSRNTTPTVSKPQGIGLHLNSIVNAMPSTCVPSVNTKPAERGYLNHGAKKPISINVKPHSISSSLAENVSAESEEGAHGTPASYTTPKSMTVAEQQETFDQAERVGELNRANPKKKRKKTEGSGDGCKRCSCKKTKCLKLYCDCFAAGIYCADTCTCQGCFNRPEYEDTVLATRQHIESRNPLAFAPKIVPRLPQLPNSLNGEDGDQVTPLGVRHKRGCNCKKSMCLKKYCECYQANVGCSDGCRCEGCQNIYGKKGVYGTSGEMGILEVVNENTNDSFDDNLKLGSIRPRFVLADFHNPQNLTPQTPSFQRSDHGKDASKARLFAGGYAPSPESDCTFYPPYSTTPRSPTDPANRDIVPVDQQPYPDLEFTDEFSPGWSNRSRSLPLGGGSFSSLRLRGAPVTPVTLFGGPKPADSDDTPTILKDSLTRLNTVKVTSPNKKRVSPPKIRLHELGSSSLKSGRKFILKAVSSFPPLTPCIDSKDAAGRNANDPPDDGGL